MSTDQYYRYSIPNLIISKTIVNYMIFGFTFLAQPNPMYPLLQAHTFGLMHLLPNKHFCSQIAGNILGTNIYSQTSRQGTIIYRVRSCHRATIFIIQEIIQIYLDHSHQNLLMGFNFRIRYKLLFNLVSTSMYNLLIFKLDLVCFGLISASILTVMLQKFWCSGSCVSITYSVISCLILHPLQIIM